jgi:glutaredoxin
MEPTASFPPIVSAPLKLYVKTWCPWCITARQYLVKGGYDFEEIDVESDRAAYAEMIRLSGQTYTPTLSADDKLLADFGPDELQLFLQRNHIKPHSDPR